MKHFLVPPFVVYALLFVFSFGFIVESDICASAQTGTLPVVQSLDFNPKSVDVSTQNAIVTFTMHVTDRYPKRLQSTYPMRATERQ